MAAPHDHHPNAPQALAELSGTVLEQRYALGRILGAGGMGAVFEARDLRLERAVAIKVLRPVFAGHTEYIKRFLREAQTASKIRHRNVVVILDYGEAAGGLVYSVMELFVGQDLEQLLRGQPEQRLPWAQACELLMQTANGLKAAHGQGVIHRDIKPANCFLTTEDDEPVVKVVDFGIAKLEDASQTQQLTSTGNLMGTPSYIAPELVRTQRPASPRSDVYSLGVVAYRMLTGRLPFTAETAFEVMRRACMDPVPRLRERVPELPAAVEGLVLEMLAKEPEKRPADMGVVRQRLQAIARETLGAQVVEIPVSSALVVDGLEDAPEDRTTLPREVDRGGTVREGPSAVEITAVQLGALAEDARPARPAGLPPRVIVAPGGVPQHVVDDPRSSPSRVGETLPVIGEATLRMGDSGTLERPRRRGAPWGVAAALVAVAGLGGVAWSVASGGRTPEGVAGAVAVGGEPEPARRAEQSEPARVIESAPVIQDPEPVEEPPVSSKAIATPDKPKAPTGPPSDAEMKKRLARKIKANCAEQRGAQSVTVSFFVTKSGSVSLVTVTPKNAAGECAKQQVVGAKFRARSGEDTPIAIEVK